MRLAPRVADSLKARVMLSLSYGCGLRAGEVVRLKVKHIDSAQKIIRVEQSKDRNVMLSPEMMAHSGQSLRCTKFGRYLGSSGQSWRDDRGGDWLWTAKQRR
jgi:integrase